MKTAKGAPILMVIIWTLGTLLLWGLAFYPMGNETPEWLNVARNVCFGAPADGLPNLGGWILLILGPISFLIVGFVAWPRELKGAVSHIWSMNSGRVIVIMALAAVALEASWVKDRLETVATYERFDYTNPSKESLPTTYPRTNRLAEDFTLVDQSGGPFRLADYKNETILFTFAFAHCQTVCPVLVRQALDIGEEFKESVRVVIITLDPWRDTPKSLPFLAKKWGLSEKAHILSGPVEDVTGVLDQFQVPYQRDERTGDVVHPALVYLIEPGGKIAYTFNNAPDQWLRQALERIASDGYTTTASR